MTSKPHNLVLERRNQSDQTAIVGPLAITPPVSEDYWAYPVRVADGQAIVGFPKFMTIGIGFAREEDWNTNLPYTCSVDEIFQHIKHNKGDESITDADVRIAIGMVRDAVFEDMATASTKKASE